MSKRSHSSSRWLQRQASDIYVQRAQKEGFRSRAVYKLEEIALRDHLFKPNMRIVDLGAAPGGWTQWAQKCLDGKARIVALDILPMDGLPEVTFIQGDFTQTAVLEALREALDGHAVDLVMSDMAPNSSGVKAVDQPRAMLLAELARDAALEMLQPQGDFLCKVFQGAEFDDYIRSLRATFKQVWVRKPKASRPTSREVYVLARERKVS